MMLVTVIVTDSKTSQQYFLYHLPFALWFAYTATSANEYPFKRLRVA